VEETTVKLSEVFYDALTLVLLIMCPVFWIFEEV